MKLIARVKFDENLFEDVDFLHEISIEYIDRFTSSFKDEEELVEFLNKYLKERNSNKKVVKIKLVDGKEEHLVIYRAYNFLCDHNQDNRVIAKLKYFDINRVYEYFENESQIDDESAMLCDELEKCNFKPNGVYYSKFHDIYKNNYMKRRYMAVSLLGGEDLLDFHGIEKTSKSVIRHILSVFYKNIDATKPTPKTVDSTINKEEYEESMVSSIMNNEHLSTEEKISELDKLLDDAEKMKEYIKEYSKKGRIL